MTSFIKRLFRTAQTGQTAEELMRLDQKMLVMQALRIAMIYCAVGALWILLSDKAVEFFFTENSRMMTLISLIKGWLYVLATATMLFSLILAALEKNRMSQRQLATINNELEHKQALLQAVFDSIPDLIFLKDRDGRYLGCNKAFESFIGKREEEIVGRRDDELFADLDVERFRSTDSEILKTKQPLRMENIDLYPDGRQVFLETLKTPYYDKSGNVIGLIGISRDLSERKARQEEIEYLNFHDSLTGLYNRAFLLTELQRLDTERQLPLSVIIGDINGLKLTNDTLGHTQGDKLLVDTAEILRRCCREDDIVARIGGDEFFILLPKTDSPAAQRVVERIREACDEYMKQPDKNVFYPNISLGHATKTFMDQPIERVQKLAEEFMYKRKLLESKSLHSSILTSIKTTMFEKSNETEAHAERLADLSQELGRNLGLSEDDLVALVLLSTLHDIGKISVDRNILTKPGPLTEDEWAEMKRHPEVGYRITQASPELRHISEHILCHHERWDGAGYPQGLSGENISLLARIIAVVDAYDAMTEDRAYRKALSKEQAVDEIRRSAGKQFDPHIAQIFIEKIIK